MAAQQQKGKPKFIRKNGKVIPIGVDKKKGAGAGKSKRQYKGRGELGSKKRKTIKKMKNRSVANTATTGAAFGGLYSLATGAKGKFMAANVIGGAIGGMIGGALAKGVYSKKLQKDNLKKARSKKSYKARKGEQGF